MRAEGAEDWHLSLRLAAEAEPVLVPDYLAVYRLNEQGMSQGDPARQLRAVRQAMNDIHSRYPMLRAQHFRDARTAINGWILPAVLRRQGLRHAAGLLAQSYLLNPLWFLNRDLRTLHLMKILTAVASRGPRRRLAEIEDPDGTRPFAFLNGPMIDGTHAIHGEAAAARSNAKDR